MILREVHMSGKLNNAAKDAERLEVEVEKDEQLEELEELDDEMLADDLSLEEEDLPEEHHYISDEAMDATHLYLSEIGFSPLLSAEEEVHFGRLALKGDAA